MAKFVTLYSGSSGNCTLISDGDASLLVDMGRSCRATLAALKMLGIAAENINAVLVTHEHSDHVNGLMTFLKRYPVPVFGAAGTLGYLRQFALVPAGARLIEIDDLTGFSVGNIVVRAFATSHDSEACVGYRFAFESGGTAAIATDLGCISDDVLEALRGCDLVALESNYDELMLAGGRYPIYLKRRIRSDRGHLSNSACAETAVLLAAGGTKQMVLMHLSQENNRPELALTACLSRLEDCGRSLAVCVAPRYDVGDEIYI